MVSVTGRGRSAACRSGQEEEEPSRMPWILAASPERCRGRSYSRTQLTLHRSATRVLFLLRTAGRSASLAIRRVIIELQPFNLFMNTCSIPHFLVKQRFSKAFYLFRPATMLAKVEIQYYSLPGNVRRQKANAWISAATLCERVLLERPLLRWSTRTPHLQLLVLQFAFQLLRLGHLAHCLVEVVLIDSVPVVLDSEETPKKRKERNVSIGRRWM